MHNRISAGGTAVIVGICLIGTTGLLFVAGWALWAAGLAAILGAGASNGGPPRRRAAQSWARIARGRIAAVAAR